MIYKNGALAGVGAKIRKPFGYVLLLLMPWVSSHAQQPNAKHAIWNASTQEIIYINGADSVFALALNKDFYTQLNHEKKKKKKTVRYRLARFGNPTELSEVPVVVSNNQSLLVMRGKLQGDTSSFFSLMLSLQDEVPVLEVLVGDVSVNELSFPLRYWGPIPQPISLIKDAVLVSEKRKRNTYRIHIYGMAYRVAFTGL